MANSEKKRLTFYFSKGINTCKETLKFLKVSQILTCSYMDGDELGLEVRWVFPLKGTERQCWWRKGLVPPLPPAVLVSCGLAVPRGAGRRWGRVDKPMMLSPNFHFAVGIGYGIPIVYGLCFSCRLHAPAQVHEVTFFGFEHMNGFPLLSSDLSRGLCQHTAPVPHNPPLMMGIR